MSHESRKRGAGANKNAVKTANSELDNEVTEFKTQWKNKAETVFRETFPKKIIELDNLAESEKFSMTCMTELNVKLNILVPDANYISNTSQTKDKQDSIHLMSLLSDKFSLTRLAEFNVKLNIPVPDAKLYQQHESNNVKKRKMDCLNDSNDNDVQGTQVYLLPNGSVPVNPMIDEIVNIVKPQAIELIGYANQIKMWISFLIPKIEDGNNFGVSIQEDTMSEARQIESEAASYLDQLSRYFLTRGKIVSKVAKYPHVDDYRRTVAELDEKQFISLRLVIIELRNHYASLHDLISKNLEKIKKPRSTNNTDNMY